MSSNDALASIHAGVMWNRLIAVVEEQAQTLVRTAFSTSVREAGDLSAGVFDLQGNMLAQAVTGTPGHINAMAIAVGHFIDAFPVAEMSEGDVFITNDPWQTCGHLHDFTVVSPTFHKGRVVALFASTAHVVDIGGRGFGPDGRQVFEEGLSIPIMPLARRGVMNQDLLRILKSNVREPLQVEGDVFSLAACNEIGSRRLVDMLTEYRLDHIERLGAQVLENSRRATEEAIATLPRGTWRYAMASDGYDRPVDLVAALTISDRGIHVDWEGSSPASGFGINLVMNYTIAYTSFGVKCIVAPEVPNNAGSLAPITVSAPEGSILNVQRPAPVAARHVIGHMLPDVVFGCLRQAIPDRVPAEGSASLWNPQLRGGAKAAAAGNRAGGRKDGFDVVMFNSGGAGARPTKDGFNATAFPSGVKAVPAEISESIVPIVIWRKEYRPDSGGAGLHRGGHGQVIEIGGLEGDGFDIFAMFDRVNHPAQGVEGGRPGAAGQVGTANGVTLRGKGQQPVPAGDRLVLELPGGGGFGDPFQRDPERVAEDVRDGLVSRDAALSHYGVALTDDLKVDVVATGKARTRPAAE